VFLWFMRRFKPRYLLHGHVHLFDLNAPRISRYYETDVINIFSSYVLERV
jgi:Icc-related predicted phosphoesterase